MRAHQTIETKLWDQNIYAVIETIKTKKQHTKWEKIFVNDVLDKGLLPKIYKELIQLNMKKNTTKPSDLKMGWIVIDRNMWKLNSTFPNNQWAKEEITRKFRKYFEMNEDIPKLTRCS